MPRMDMESEVIVNAGITPYATLYHWDLPQGLLDPPRVSGWWSRDSNGKPNGEIIQDWIDYCDIVFDALGDRVKYWVTFNEPWTFVFLGSGFGKAPGIPEFSDQGRDPYVAAHNVLNAHAAAVNLYRTKYASKQGGKIGITNNADWREPKTAQPSDVAAADRTVLFQLGWFSEPIFGGNGDYPPEMRKLYGDRLPRFTTEQRRLLNGSADFFGLNHYGTSWAEYDPGSPHPDDSYAATSHDGFVQGGSVWLYGGAASLMHLPRDWGKRAESADARELALPPASAQEGLGCDRSPSCTSDGCWPRAARRCGGLGLRRTALSHGRSGGGQRPPAARGRVEEARPRSTPLLADARGNFAPHRCAYCRRWRAGGLGGAAHVAVAAAVGRASWEDTAEMEDVTAHGWSMCARRRALRNQCGTLATRNMEQQKKQFQQDSDKRRLAAESLRAAPQDGREAPAGWRCPLVVDGA
ncbi:unnamed protein product [Prorocentrum cordatum]|uniref:Beta-glucosidase n=1 Tax=Prorocentrum cordatum TaxID=2364126 RepID=A0ABN9SYC7_9DINO|nr:unnamed protein product [Polarella glacialis]